jgi:C-terminal processing protease CtpA/Prc
MEHNIYKKLIKNNIYTRFIKNVNFDNIHKTYLSSKENSKYDCYEYCRLKNMLTFPNNMDRDNYGIWEVNLNTSSYSNNDLKLSFIKHNLYVSHVRKDSVFDKNNIKLGDQILSINNIDTFNKWMDGMNSVIHNKTNSEIKILVRNRQNVIKYNLIKNSNGYFGFTFTNGCIDYIIPNTSAHKNGLLQNYMILEINNQSVLSCDDDKLESIFKSQKDIVHITIMEYDFYKILTVGLFYGPFIIRRINNKKV